MLCCIIATKIIVYSVDQKELHNSIVEQYLQYAYLTLINPKILTGLILYSYS